MHDVYVERKLRKVLRTYLRSGTLFKQTIDQLFVGDVVLLLREGHKLMFCALEDLTNSCLDLHYELRLDSVCAIQNVSPEAYKFYTTSGCIDVNMHVWTWPILKMKT